MAQRAKTSPHRRPVMWSTVATVVAIAIAPFSAAPAALADDGEQERLQQILAGVPAKYSVLEGNASNSTARRGAPEELGRLSVVSDSGAEISILPEPAHAYYRAIPLAIGATAFAMGDDTYTVPLRKTDGSLQILSIVESSVAPTSFDYDLNLPAGGRLEEGESGAILALSSDGEFLGAISPPWAVDAAGNAVPTRYEISGSTVTQIVDHHASGVQYPVVADPWLGQALYYQPSVSTTINGYIISVVPTQFGGTMSSPTNLYMWWAHADEVKNKLGSNSYLWNTKIQEQLYCHIAGYPVSAQPAYDMESWRPFMYWEQLTIYKCNP